LCLCPDSEASKQSEISALLDVNPKHGMYVVELLQAEPVPRTNPTQLQQRQHQSQQLILSERKRLGVVITEKDIGN
jgi:hypothetical protein